MNRVWLGGLLLASGLACGDSDDVESIFGDGVLCSNTCDFARDGECDDGGPDAQFDVCELGTDCVDCGARQEQGGTVTNGQNGQNGENGQGGTPGGNGTTPGGPGQTMCTNTCEFANDGECDDGGPGAEFDVCALGTDCDDCGPR